MTEPNYELLSKDDVPYISEKPVKKKEKKNIVSGFLMVLTWIYLISVSLIFVPFYNWQFAKDNGFVKWLVFGEVVPTAKAIVWPYFIFFAHPASSIQTKGAVTLLEYVDNDYGFAFQYPSNWKMFPPPPKDESSEVRVAIKTPSSNVLMVSTEKLYGPTPSRAEFIGNPKSSTVVDSLINLTIEAVYKKTSIDIGASRMVVAEKYSIPSDVAIKFYINTLHFIKTDKGELPTIITAIHCLPFDKDYSIRLMMTCTVDPTAKEENEALANVLNSFHLIGETPLGKKP